MYYEEKLCVPLALTGRVVRAHHAHIGHIGGERLWKDLVRRFNFTVSSRYRFLAMNISKECEICQAHNYPTFQIKGPIEPTYIPSQLGMSLSVDLFMMPSVVWNKQHFDCMIVCVDRESGWMMVSPFQSKGLTAEKAATDMFSKWWLPFGIPSIITSDQGPQFAGAFWKTLCALFGVRSAYSQAYNPQANGRAEVAGKTFKTFLRKIAEEEHECWVQLIPHVLRKYHDIPGPTGLSPYQIIFGRHRPLAGLPYEIPKPAFDAEAFFLQMEKFDEMVANHMNALHQQKCEDYNKKRHPKPIYQTGDLVWFRRPSSLKSTLHSVWEGPCKVLRRIGFGTYVIELKDDVLHTASDDQLKPHYEDKFVGKPKPLHYWVGESYDPQVGVEEAEVEKIVKHRVQPDGTVQFLTKWVGDDLATWEPVGNFIHRYSSEFVKYARDQQLDLNILDSLSSEPSK